MKRLGSFNQVGTIGWVDHSISACSQPSNKRLSLYDRLGLELKHITAIEPVDILVFLNRPKMLQDEFHKQITDLYLDARIEAKKLIPETYEIKSVLHEQQEHRLCKAPEHIKADDLLAFSDIWISKSTPIFISLGVYDADDVFLYYFATFACFIDASCKLQIVVFRNFE